MRYHCIKCNEDDVHVHAGDGYHFGCSGRAIPIAIICDPPEPTVIDASDIAPGMVVVAVDEPFYGMALLVTPDVVLLSHGKTWAFRMALVDEVDALWVAEGGAE